ncbi:hypothetical protein SEMRO_3598_G349500.1 [Seminavis robusta]|uniref:Uncharacterized protein n=1 Tax=Seminavis robusta TaxID=568900 RepID=A0A9N8HY35_9STRA|nr:hypothetical protein SEMRO_3598_G349500.1 [Seminavis robusta]|eukprot:Sro3598_g349500.1 n/a (259) ;mRNA; f:2725-3501
MQVDLDDEHYLFTNPYTGKSYIKRKQRAMQDSATMPHQELVHESTQNMDFSSWFNTGASKNRCAVKRRPTTNSTATVNGRAGKIPRKATGSVAPSVPQNIHLTKNNSDVTEKPDDDDVSSASGEDFDEKVRNIVDNQIGGNLEEYTRKKFVKSIRDPITKSQKEALERLRGDVVPQLNVANGNIKDAMNKLCQFRMEYDNNKAQDRRFQQFVVEKLGQMNGTIEALGRYLLMKLGSNDGLDDNSLANMVSFDRYDGSS